MFVVAIVVAVVVVVAAVAVVVVVTVVAVVVAVVAFDTVAVAFVTVAVAVAAGSGGVSGAVDVDFSSSLTELFFDNRCFDIIFICFVHMLLTVVLLLSVCFQ